MCSIDIDNEILYLDFGKTNWLMTKPVAVEYLVSVTIQCKFILECFTDHMLRKQANTTATISTASSHTTMLLIVCEKDTFWATRKLFWISDWLNKMGVLKYSTFARFINADHHQQAKSCKKKRQKPVSIEFRKLLVGHFCYNLCHLILISSFSKLHASLEWFQAQCWTIN